MRFERFPIILAVLLTLSLATAPLFGQSLTTGNITGTVLDPSHAVVPNATVSLKSLDTGLTASAITNATGSYNFSLLRPGRYLVSVKQAGFAEVAQTIEVQVGQTSTANIDLAVAKGVETVEVSAAAPLINTEPSINTAYTPQEVAQLPSAGGDITNIADTTPGVITNSTGGYGNFTVNGLPATSNLFTVNGENDMDPYFNINNSGATNLTLGQNEISEATVVTNPYSGQYGQLSGAQVTYVTKSGTNSFHGNAAYWWNGRYLNSNDWMFNNTYDGTPGSATPRPFSNANQYAASIGGPIIKNKTFFFVDYEGLRFILPNADLINAPSQAFGAAVLANVKANQPAEYPFYQKLIGLYEGTPGYASGSPLPETWCINNDVLSSSGKVKYPGLNGSGMNLAQYGFTANADTTGCTVQFNSAATAFAKEYILSGRVDQKIGNNDSAFFRYKADRGVQPTTIDPISSNFDAISNQPSWDTQLQETHIFGPTATNSFTASLSHYVAQFVQNHQLAASTFPYDVVASASVTFGNQSGGAGIMNLLHDFPQGRNITQYQFIDDFSWSRGNHTLKFGENFRRYDVSDHNFFYTYPRVYFGYNNFGMFNFADGYAYQYRQAKQEFTNVPVALWGIGAYAQDEWKARPNLKLTLALRLERNSNPVCQTNCFANFSGAFTTLPSYQAAAAGNDPADVAYSQDIKYNQHQAYPGVDSVVISPRFGFSWDPRSNGKTVFSGGFGIFYDSPAAGVVDNLLTNPPVSVTFRVRPPCISALPPAAPCGTLAFDPGPNGGGAAWQASANAFSITQSFSQIQAGLPAGVAFNPPAFTSIVGTVKAPEWQEWNFSVQQELNRSTVLLLNYVGNHGARIPYQTGWPNAYDPYDIFGGAVPFVPATMSTVATNAAGGFPTGSYGTVTETRSGAVSNYNGLTVSLRKQFSKWVAGHLNYTWSHNLDEVSNGGIFTYGDSILGQISPYGLRQDNYGNSDYDIRHSLNGDFVLNPEFHYTGPIKWLVNGWQLSGKLFWRTGLPFEVVDNNLAGYVFNGGGTIPAQVTGNVQPGGCGKAAASIAGTGTPCLDTNQFVQTGDPTWPGYNNFWPTQRRNQYHAPHYFDMDLNLFKNFKFAERFNGAIGIQAFNAFNHPNFGFPDNGFGDSTFGQISSMTPTATSPYGTFLGFDSSIRVVQLSAKIVF